MSRARGESLTSPRRIEATEKSAQALELRKAGLSYEQIAKSLGMRGRSSAHYAVTSAMRKTIQEPADELRQIELARLDAMLLAIWPAVKRGDLYAVDRALKISKRRSELLGLDAPVKIEADVTTYAEQLDPDAKAAIEEAERIIAANLRQPSDGAQPADVGDIE